MKNPMIPVIRQADQSINQNGEKLGRLLDSPALRKADGGRVARATDTMRLVKDAIDSLRSNDAASARNMLRSVNDPQVQDAASTIGRGPQGLALAIKKLEGLVESLSNSSQVPMLKKGGAVKK